MTSIAAVQIPPPCPARLAKAFVFKRSQGGFRTTEIAANLRRETAIVAPPLVEKSKDLVLVEKPLTATAANCDRPERTFLHELHNARWRAFDQHRNFRRRQSSSHENR
jgi:hypothetical protein